MPALTYSDFCQRLSMEDILKAAGYRFNRRDGMRYPSYVAVDSLGQRIKGDKFIVMPDRRRCFQPPFQQTYNVVSFIRAFPEKFMEYQMGMSTDKLVNLVCNRLLNSPMEMDESGFKTIYDNKPFDLTKFKVATFDLDNWQTMRGFYPYFRARGIDLSTMRAFSRSFIMTSKVTSSGKEHINLSFPLRQPSTEEGSRIHGLELRSRPDKDGKTKFKGLAQGSEATTGLWMATPDTEQWKRDLQDKRPLKEKLSSSNPTEGNKGIEFKTKSDYKLPLLPQNADIYWFESAYDAMAYYQLNRRKADFSKAIFVSTSGNPSVRQFQTVMDRFPNSRHHLCFDNDMAGRMFTLNFLLRLKGDGYCTRMDKAKDLLVIYDAWKSEPVLRIPCSEFNVKDLCQTLNIDPRKVIREVPFKGYKDWNDQLLGLIAMRNSAREQQLSKNFNPQVTQEVKVNANTNTPSNDIDMEQSRGQLVSELTEWTNEPTLSKLEKHCRETTGFSEHTGPVKEPVLSEPPLIEPTISEQYSYQRYKL